MDAEESAFVYWPFIEQYLPGYYSCDEVLHSDILTRYLDGEEVLEGDLNWISELGTREDVVAELIDIDSWLFQEALEAYLQERYKGGEVREIVNA
ncbi:MAG: 6-phospho-beta-glucosidase [bacterium]